MFGCPGKDIVELLVSLVDAVDLLMHGNFVGENNEETSFCRGEHIRFKYTSLPPALHCLIIF